MNIDKFYEPFFRYFRGRRMRRFVSEFQISANSHILDVGGTPFNWSLVPVEPEVTLLNVDIVGERWDGRFRWVPGDGCALQFADQEFDICYSNSVIEHVGGWEAQQRFAAEVQRVAGAYYVQTPNRWFFIEPHVVGAFIHWLPLGLYRRLARVLSVRGWLIRDSGAERDAFLRGIRLLTEREVRLLFPDAEIQRERFCGMTKSIIASRRAFPMARAVRERFDSSRSTAPTAPSPLIPLRVGPRLPSRSDAHRGSGVNSEQYRSYDLKTTSTQ